MAEEVQYTVFIRLPFPRGDFVDPPQVSWNSSKDQALWDITSKGPARAEQFDVDLAFLLQQAAWLYERQLSQVKAQLRKVSKPSLTAQSPTPSSVSGSGIAGGQAMARTTSGGSRVPSSLAMRQRERPSSQGEGSLAGFSPPARATGTRMSRNSSTNTVYQVQKASPTVTHQAVFEESPSPSTKFARMQDRSRKSSDIIPQEASASTYGATSPSSKADDDDSTSSSSSSDSGAAAAHPLSRSRAYLRRPRHTNPRGALLRPLSDADEENDDADSPPFLPFSNAAKATGEPQSQHSHPPTTVSPSATLRTTTTNPTIQPPHKPPKGKTPAAPPPPPLTSSSSSAHSSQPPHHTTTNNNNSIKPASALSPRQRRIAKDGSEGTSPSMGSSFSDLDDASVTQSALEEALAHEMAQGGGVASRMSTISQALRSRYL
ncbi:MAG: hypothetical protein Q9220_001955 [cf. Caloplaca sp. 1 TL-2023]